MYKNAKKDVTIYLGGGVCLCMGKNLSFSIE